MTDPAQPVEATPRTKRAIMDTLWEGTSVYELVRADFTRQLERELAVANRQLQLAQTENAGHIRIEDELKAELREALERLAAAEKEAARCRWFLDRINVLDNAAASDRKPKEACPLCGRTGPHSHSSGPFGIS
jgi:DNA repair exonuclease SbcCD ATPase subunit